MLTTTVMGRTWNFSHAIGRNAAAGNGFTQPVDVAIGSAGTLYVLSRGQEGADGIQAPNKRIGKLTIDEDFIGDFAREQLVFPSCIAVDSSSNVYCSDEYERQIKIWDEDGQRIGQWDGGGRLKAPSGIAFDSQDDLYIADSVDNTVSKFTKDGEFLFSFGRHGSEAGELNRPWGLTIDSEDAIFVADWGNNRVQKFTAEGAYLLTFGGESGGVAGALNHPASVAVDSEGDVYVSDWGDKLIKIFESNGSIITQLEGDATEFSKWAREVVESNPDVVKAYRRVKDRKPLGYFNRPVGIAIDEEDRLIVTDSTRGRLQVYEKEKDYLDPQFNL